MVHIDIKPCPFCGGKADIRHGTVNMDIVYRVECLSCHVTTAQFFVDDHHTEAEEICMAVNAWNRRENDGNKP